MLSRALTVGLLAGLAGCGGNQAIEAVEGAPPTTAPSPTAVATSTPRVGEPTKGLWTRLTCKDRVPSGVVYGRLPPEPAPDRTAREALDLFLEDAAHSRPPFNQLADLEWEQRNYLKRPQRWARHTVFVGSLNGIERAAVYVDRVQPGPTWITGNFLLCVEPVPPRVTTTRAYDAPLTCPGEATRVATDPPKEDWGVAADGYLRHGLHEFLRWTRIEDFGWPAGLTYERRQPHTRGYADMVGTKDGIEQAVVTLEHTATHDAWVMTGYAWCRSGP
jgi:hypothetical protein